MSLRSLDKSRLGKFPRAPCAFASVTLRMAISPSQGGSSLAKPDSAYLWAALALEKT